MVQIVYFASHVALSFKGGATATLIKNVIIQALLHLVRTIAELYVGFGHKLPAN